MTVTALHPTLLEVVSAALNDEAVQPIGDRLTVQSAVIVPYTVKAKLILAAGFEAELILALTQARLTAYINQQRRLGRDIHLQHLIASKS